MLKSQPKVVDIFSGVGGLSLGAALAGMNVAVAIENDPHAHWAHQKNFPLTKHLKDDVSTLPVGKIREALDAVSGEFLGVIGGPPCQGFSTIGHRSLADPRNRLFVRFFELVRDLRPAFFLAENVPGIMDPENASLRDEAIALVKDEYSILAPLKVVAEDYGVPTTRTRYLFFGYKTNAFERISADDLRCRTTKRYVKDVFKGLPARVYSSWNSDAKSWRTVDYRPLDPALARQLKDMVPKGVGDAVALQRLRDENLVSAFFGTVHTDEVKQRFAKVKQGGADRISKCRRLEWDGFCPTLRAGTGADRGSYQAVRPLHPSANRVITPREAARLQSFPDWFQFSPTKWHGFRQIGNSVCPLLAKRIIASILLRRKK